AAAGEDGVVTLWATGGDAPPHRFPAGPAVRALAWSPDGKRLAAGRDDGRIQILSLEGDLALVRLSFLRAAAEQVAPLAHAEAVPALAFPPDGRRRASGGRARAVRLWASDEARIAALLAAGNNAAPAPSPPDRHRGDHDGAVTDLAFSPDGVTLASAGRDPAA